MDSPTVVTNIIGEENSHMITSTICTEIEIPEVAKKTDSNSAKQPPKKKSPSSQKNAIILEGNNPRIKTKSISTETETPKVTKRKIASDNAKPPPKKQKPSGQKNAIIVEENSPQKKTKTISTEVGKPEVSKRKTGSENAKELPKTKKPPTSPYADMVVEAINSLKMRAGAPKESIMQYLEENHGIDKKSKGRYVTRFLKSGCEKGILEEVSEERFKMKKVEKAKTGKASEEKSKEKKQVKTSS